MDKPNTKTLLIISQVYPPDPASVGQHMADAAAEMARRGYRVRVLTANRGYDDPSIKYESHELRDGVEVRRLPISSFGKGSIPVRVLGACSFLLQCIVRGWFTPRLSGILVSTSPPMASFAALAVALFRRVPIKYWAMDLNPDQAIALGRVREGALSVKAFRWLNRTILRKAHDVIALDRFMADRLKAQADIEAKLVVTPPWPHDDHLEVVPHDQNPFREKHGLAGKRVIMFSGNMSIASPLTAILEAGLRFQDRDELVFMFIGGGGGKKAVERFIAEHKPNNMRVLPYQPLAELRYSLSSADVHVVAVGDAVVGICHPCKVYGAMAVARPVLLLGPDPCHISDIIRDHNVGWHVAQGDTDGAAKVIQSILDTDPQILKQMGETAKRLIDEKFSKKILLNKFCDVVERGL